MNAQKLGCFGADWVRKILFSASVVSASVLLATGAFPIDTARAESGAATTNSEEDGTVQFLFIHHSCGGQLLADPGQDVGKQCVYESHPNGGGLRGRLEAEGFAVNEASYGSVIGDDTDICHWNAKFRDQMELILSTRLQDELLPDGVTNNIVAFKSCFPNNLFVGEGTEPGDPDSCELTLANAEAAYRKLLVYFAEQPDVLFVAFTAPPLAEATGFRGWLKRLVKGKSEHHAIARKFNNWMADTKGGWLAEYPLKNIAVFDHYDVLTNHGEVDWSAYPSEGGSDSHPNSEGNHKAADEFVPFLEKAMATMEASSS